MWRSITSKLQDTKREGEEGSFTKTNIESMRESQRGKSDIFTKF